MRGDHQLNEASARWAATSAGPSEEPTCSARIPAAWRGRRHEDSVYADEALRGTNLMTTGANEDGFHCAM